MNIFSLCHLMKFIAFIFIWKVFPASENGVILKTKDTRGDHFMGDPGSMLYILNLNFLGHVHKVVVKKENY